MASPEAPKPIESTEEAFAICDELINLGAYETLVAAPDGTSFLRERTIDTFSIRAHFFYMPKVPVIENRENIPTYRILGIRDENKQWGFTLDARGLTYLGWGISSIQIGEEAFSFRLGMDMNPYGPFLINQSSFRKSSIPLVEWFRQINTTGVYVPPPITITAGEASM